MMFPLFSNVLTSNFPEDVNSELLVNSLISDVPNILIVPLLVIFCALLLSFNFIKPLFSIMLNVVLPFVVIVAFSLFVTVPSNSVVLFVCTVLSFVKLLIISFDDVRFVSPLFIMLLY